MFENKREKVNNDCDQNFSTPEIYRFFQDFSELTVLKNILIFLDVVRVNRTKCHNQPFPT